MDNYALNVADMADVVQGRFGMAFQILFGGKVSDRTVEVEPGKIDGMGVTLKVPDEQAAATIEVMRARIPRHVLRAYRRTGNTWTQI